ncbi:hypothetical protein DL96DRAFT_1702987 [Flagelloscypha sp. PMI_526]|nr:hypothetical protein DL96DRAFT_1702987 [Flagelloscypha sp. PMI_526]
MTSPLPHELLSDVFRFCDKATLATASCVNHEFSHIADIELYRHICLDAHRAKRILHMAKHCLPRIQHLSLVHVDYGDTWLELFRVLDEQSGVLRLVSLRIYRDRIATQPTPLIIHSQIFHLVSSISNLALVGVGTDMLPFVEVIRLSTLTRAVFELNIYAIYHNRIVMLPPPNNLGNGEVRPPLTELVLSFSPNITIGIVSRYFDLQNLTRLAFSEASATSEQITSWLIGTANGLHDLSLSYDESFNTKLVPVTSHAGHDDIHFPKLTSLALYFFAQREIRWSILRSTISYYVDHAPRLRELRLYLDLRGQSLAHEILDNVHLCDWDARLRAISIYMWNPPLFSNLHREKRAERALGNTIGWDRLVKMCWDYKWTALTMFCEPIQETF